MLPGDNVRDALVSAASLGSEESGEQSSSKSGFENKSGSENPFPSRAAAPQSSARSGLTLGGKNTEKGFQTQLLGWGIGITMLPVLILGVGAYWGNRALYQQISQSTPANPAPSATVKNTAIALQRQRVAILVGTGSLGLLAGGIAVLLINQLTGPILEASTIARSVVNRLRREDETQSLSRLSGTNEVEAIRTHVQFIDQQLPSLLWNQEAEAERSQRLLTITQRIRNSRSEEEVLKATVNAVRSAFRLDRIAVFRFDANWDGTFIEEAVAAGWPKALWSTVSDPCFSKTYVEAYNEGRIRATDDIYCAGLSDCYIGLMERFAVRANIIAPIHRRGQLFGLLMGHQCSGPRFWQKPEIDLFAQIAEQVGFALDYTELLEQLDARFNQAQVFINVVRQIREFLIEEDILKTTVEEVRKVLRSDRVMVYTFDADWYGTVVEESVAPGLPKALHARIKDPCFAEGYVEKYQRGRVQATPNVHEAGLTECHLAQLAPFAVMANLVAPILGEGKLLGLLIAHECSGPRNWHPSEVDFFAQVATQVGFALDQARLLSKIDEQNARSLLLAEISDHIRASLDEETILQTAVDATRKALRSSRVIIYSFAPDWSGTVTAESVLPGFPKALYARINDPCFVNSYVEKYQSGRVQAVQNVHTAGLTECHLKQLKPFEVQASVVAPIFCEKDLVALLIAHECSAPRSWSQSEIDFCKQIAAQVGFALDHARSLKQLDQAYLTADLETQSQFQQRSALQQHVLAVVNKNDAIVQTLSQDALQQMDLVRSVYNQLQTMMTSAQRVTESAHQVEDYVQRTREAIHAGQDGFHLETENLSLAQTILADFQQKLRQLDPQVKKLFEVANHISSVSSQVKLQAMNVALEAGRVGEPGREFASIAEGVLASGRQLDAELTELRQVATTVQTQSGEVLSALHSDLQPVLDRSWLLGSAPDFLTHLVQLATQMENLMQDLTQVSRSQEQAASATHQSVIELATITSQTSEQALAIANSLTRLTETAGKF